MIDIHTHLLPGVDDGPKTLDDSIEMIRQGYHDGIRGAVCTSHIINRLDKQTESTYINAFVMLSERVRQEGIDMRLWLASEIHCQAQFDSRSRIATFRGNRKYLLFEFSMHEIPAEAEDRLFDLAMDGVVPIIAHPERYTKIMQKPSIAYEFVNRGMLLQVNAGSIVGVFGSQVQETAHLLLEHRLVHFVASDCHDVNARPMLMSQGFHLVSKTCGDEAAKQLFYHNAAKAIQGDPIVPPVPVPFSRQKKRKKILGIF